MHAIQKPNRRKRLTTELAVEAVVSKIDEKKMKKNARCKQKKHTQKKKEKKNPVQIYMRRKGYVDDLFPGSSEPMQKVMKETPRYAFDACEQ